MRVDHGKVGFQMVREDDIKEILPHMQLYTPSERLNLPLFVLKTPSKKLPLLSLSSAMEETRRLFSLKGKL